MSYNPDKYFRGRSYRKGGELIQDLRDIANIKADKADDRDVHTEHCCAEHGCKYGDEHCPVETGKKVQSFPCESCDEESSQTYFAAWRIENHPDREMTFLGIFSTEARAQKAIDRHRATGKSVYFPDGWPEYEYSIRECSLNGENF